MEIIPNDVVKIRVTSRPMAVPYNYRTSYKICQLLMIISKNNSRATCSLEKIQIVSQVFSSETAFNDLVKFLEVDEIFMVRFDPIINRAVTFAIAEQLITQQKNGKYKLTQIGKRFMQLIDNDTELLKNEIGRAHV